jgi:hypothetical protein
VVTASVPEKADYLIDLGVILASGSLSILIGWGVATSLHSTVAILTVDTLFTVVIGSVSYFTAFCIKEKIYGN